MAFGFARAVGNGEEFCFFIVRSDALDRIISLSYHYRHRLPLLIIIYNSDDNIVVRKVIKMPTMI